MGDDYVAHSMPLSSRYRGLRSRLRELRNHFLPRSFDPTGTYTERQIDRARAFRLLAHAEIEWYLEEIVVETANTAFDAWRQRGIITEPMVAMVAYVETTLGDVPQLYQAASSRDLNSRMERSKNYFNTYVKSRNHGIRERNVLRLLLPVGINELDIDSLWLATTDSFGQSRGLTAHSSNQVYNPPDPRNEFEIVRQILEGLSAIDAKLLSFRLL